MRYANYSGPRQPAWQQSTAVSYVGLAKRLANAPGLGAGTTWRYELWSSKSRNLVKAFATRDQALGYVRTLMDRRGVDYAERLVLVREDSSGNSDRIAAGKGLVSIAKLNFIERAVLGDPVHILAEAS